MSISKLLIVLLIVALVFGTSKLKNIGTDLGQALKNFKKAMNDKETTDETKLEEQEKSVTDKKTDDN